MFKEFKNDHNTGYDLYEYGDGIEYAFYNPDGNLEYDVRFCDHHSMECRKFHYNDGRLLYAEEYTISKNGDRHIIAWEKFFYDKYGRLIKTEESVKILRYYNRHYERYYQYDDNDNMTKFEDSFGRIVTRTYTSDGKLISEGFSHQGTTIIRDPDWNIIYLKPKNGWEHWYEYNNDGKCVYHKDFKGEKHYARGLKHHPSTSRFLNFKPLNEELNPLDHWTENSNIKFKLKGILYDSIWALKHHFFIPWED